MKSTTMDYDKKLVTEWKRLGSCNHCGECCQTMIYMDEMPYSDIVDGRTDGSTSPNGKGVWHEWVAFGRQRYWQIRIERDEDSHNCYDAVCDAIGECRDGSQVKGLLCTAWPLHPDHVNEFDNCSYHFIKLNEWEMDDDTELKEAKEVSEALEKVMG